MYRKIVIGLDGSDNAAHALDHAKELARLSGAEVVAVYVDERIAAKGDMPSVHPGQEEIRETIDGQLAELADAGIKSELVSTTVVLGGPGREIAAVAERADADLIVVGTRGHSSIPGLILGSVAHRLLHVAGRPVLAVPPSS